MLTTMRLLLLWFALWLAPPREKPCPFDGQPSRLFAERDKDGQHQCGYSHDYQKDAQHFLHVFWTDCN